MTPQELKNSILQLAIQGKLVEQRPEEGTAASLLSHTKVADSVDGQRVKEKTVTAISDNDTPFDIPHNWEWVKLGLVCTIARGGSPRPIKDYITEEENGVNWIKIGDTDKNGKYIYKTAEKIKPSGVSKSRMVHSGDFLLTNSMSFGRPYILKTDGCIHDGWLVISQTSEVFDQDYLYWLLSSAFAYSQFSDKVSGAVVKNLNSDKVANSVFPLPPLAEQKRIVAKIEELLPYIDRYEKAWNRLEDFNKRFPADMQKSILQLAIQGKLTEQRSEEGTGEALYQQIQKEKQALIKAGKIKNEKPLSEISEDEIPFDIPESWKWVRVAEITTLNPKNELDDNLDVAFIPMPCVSDGYRNTHTFEIRKWKDIKKGFTHFADYDIGVAKITPCFQNRKSVIFQNLINGYGAGTTELSIIRVINNSVSREYLLWFFKTDYFISNGVKSFTGTAGQQRIHKDYLSNCLIPLPPLAEQKRIVAKLEELLPLCKKMK